MSLAVGVARTVFELLRLGVALGVELARERVTKVKAGTLRIIDRRRKAAR